MTFKNQLIRTFAVTLFATMNLGSSGSVFAYESEYEAVSMASLTQKTVIGFACTKKSAQGANVQGADVTVTQYSYVPGNGLMCLWSSEVSAEFGDEFRDKLFCDLKLEKNVYKAQNSNQLTGRLHKIAVDFNKGEVRQELHIKGEKPIKGALKVVCKNRLFPLE